MSDIVHTADSMVCQLCRTGLLVFVQTGVVDLPHVKVYRCYCCGAEELR
jgi:hypothetical protein